MLILLVFLNLLSFY